MRVYLPHGTDITDTPDGRGVAQAVLLYRAAGATDTVIQEVILRQRGRMAVLDWDMITIQPPPAGAE